MSDIAIKNMKMPQNCWDCPLINTKPCPCKGYSTALEHVTDRHPDCPLDENGECSQMEIIEAEMEHE